MAIHVLSQDVVAQIAAGEVVERPTSVVKELLENSLDAGARHIRLSITGDGRKRIQISDDGCGIEAAEIELAFLRHATSKLETASDLYRIQTLGFRGEALASIASVSQIKLTSRNQAENIGTALVVEGGEIRQRKPVGVPAGTVITVENLFYNTPARLKFLKGEMSEKRQIASVVTRYAMAYPHVAFHLEQDGREVFRTNGGGNLADVIVNALGLDHLKNMVEVDDTHNDIAIYGFASAPSLNRADRSRITLFVNGRYVQDTGLTHAVVQAYHTLLMTGRYPIAILMLTLNPEDVDVNVHPTKAEIRFRDHDAAFSAMQRAVRRAIIGGAQTPTMRGQAPQYHQFEEQQRLELPMESPGQHARQRMQPDYAENDDDPTAIPIGLGQPTQPRTLPMLRVVGQIAASYIVAEAPAGMYLVDQHAAHERILYEQFMAEYTRQKTVAQLALTPESVQVAPAEARLIEEKLPLLSELGFQLEPFGPNIFIVRAVPAILSDVEPSELIRGIIDDLEQGNKPGMESIEDKIVMRVCKQAAVKAGQVLSYEQMQGLIRQLERCQSPLTCPHGRPTMIHMSNDRLAREFGRLGA
ncbi:MAG: DNA mismatch repair endonuclease MutL [Chloroflexi bacterium]|nr:DNA mismatch repair endonuclease MutL [Chloroflexota bacterium]